MIPASVNADWTRSELTVLESLRTPAKIQEFLDAVPYSIDPIYRSPRSVLRDRRAHCFDGAVFAAACIERIGFPPLLLELKAECDDDHLLAIYRIDGCWGALAKSNYVGLRFREPIYRGLRELAISYFASYFNPDAEKTLRAYSAILRLDRFERWIWRFEDGAMDQMERALNEGRHFPLVTSEQISRLNPVDPRTYKGEMTGTDPAGLYRL